MNDDLISRQAAIDECNKRGAEHIGYAIAHLPSVQPESIRCKDCLMHGVCRFEQGLGLDGYCSQAKRRANSETD